MLCARCPAPFQACDGKRRGRWCPRSTSPHTAPNASTALCTAPTHTHRPTLHPTPVPNAYTHTRVYTPTHAHTYICRYSIGFSYGEGRLLVCAALPGRCDNSGAWGPRVDCCHPGSYVQYPSSSPHVDGIRGGCSSFSWAALLLSLILSSPFPTPTHITNRTLCAGFSCSTTQLRCGRHCTVTCC